PAARRRGFAGVVDPGALPRARVHPRAGQAGRQGSDPSAAPERRAARGRTARRSAARRRGTLIAAGAPPIPLGTDARGVPFEARLLPRAGRTTIAGVRAGALLIRLAAAPVDGAANDALVALIADALGCRHRDITILSGHTSRTKRLAVAAAPERVANWL